jgi:hypothetical protein
MKFNPKAFARRHGSNAAIAAVAATASAMAFGGVAFPATSSAPAAVPTLSLTVSGTDAHSLDARLKLQFVPGGGVIGVFESGQAPTTPYNYFELPLDLPVGAKVTSVAVTHSICSGGNSTTAVFGSYSPTSRVTQQNATLAMNKPSDCGARTVTKTGNPITTIAAGRRYEIDYQNTSIGAYPGFNDVVLYGATVKYTCTSPCVP